MVRDVWVFVSDNRSSNDVMEGQSLIPLQYAFSPETPDMRWEYTHQSITGHSEHTSTHLHKPLVAI